MDIAEADTMALVRTHTTIRIHKVRRFMSLPDRPAILVMEYIRGESLYQYWNRLSLWRKLHIAWALRRYMQQLRKIRVRLVEIPGPVGKVPLRCKGRWFTERGAGPFASYPDLTEWFNGRLAVSKRFKLIRLDPNEPPFDHSDVSQVFTRQDIHMRNIIVGGKTTLCSFVIGSWLAFIRSTLNTSVWWKTTEPLGCGDSLYLSLPVFIPLGINFCVKPGGRSLLAHI